MRRLLSPAACWSYTPPVGGGARLSPYLLPPPIFRLLSPLPDPWGWGVAAVPPQPAF